jgi:hypothetical protein
MNEQELAQWLEQALADLRLRVQVKAQPLQSSPGDYALVIMINHPAHVALDHERLTAWFQKAIPSRYPQVKRLALYSRPIGQQQANWKTQVRLAPEAATGRGDPADSPDLSRYCFVQDRQLLTADLPQPSSVVRQAVLGFHNLTAGQKEEVLPLLPTLFRNPGAVSTAMLSVDAALWLEPLKSLNPHELRLLSVWLSRYCFNPSRALADLDPATSNLRTGQTRRRYRAPQTGVSLVLASFAGNLTLAAGVTLSLLFGMVFVLALAVFGTLEGGVLFWLFSFRRSAHPGLQRPNFLFVSLVDGLDPAQPLQHPVGELGGNWASQPRERGGDRPRLSPVQAEAAEAGLDPRPKPYCFYLWQPAGYGPHRRQRRVVHLLGR